jgi:hypothetical protein
MFNLLGVTLLQPESTISARLPGGAVALGSLVDALRGKLEGLYASDPTSGARSLFLALAPAGRLQLWLAAADGELTSEERARVEALAEHVSAPELVGGPVALTLVYSIGEEAPAEAQLTLPDEWRAVVEASDSDLSVEQILTRVWSLTN